MGFEEQEPINSRKIEAVKQRLSNEQVTADWMVEGYYGLTELHFASPDRELKER